VTAWRRYLDGLDVYLEKSFVFENASRDADRRQRALLCLSVQKRYGETPVVRNLSLSVDSGEILALLGSSGCGKTTTLRMIAGLEAVDGGCIEVDGVLVAGAGRHDPPERRRIGMVFQDYALFPHLSVGKNVAFGLPRGIDARTRVEETLELVGLAGFGNRMPQDLSGGQQQRVALARALAPQPRILLMDEPFSNLDPDLRITVRGEVRDILKRAGATAILVTHDQEEALSMADQVALMIDGEVVQVADPETLYQHPESREVARFIGESYFLPGTATGTLVETEIGCLELESPMDGRVDVMVRPEVIAVSAPADGEPVNGMVVRREYFGRHQMLSVALPSGSVVRAMAGARARYRAGDDIHVAVTGPVVAFPVELA